jgi:hypothetical protein
LTYITSNRIQAIIVKENAIDDLLYLAEFRPIPDKCKQKKKEYYFSFISKLILKNIFFYFIIKDIHSLQIKNSKKKDKRNT